MIRFITALGAGLLTAQAAMADRVDIDDDGWSMQPDPSSVGFTVDIDDDGWSREELGRADGMMIDIDDDGWSRVDGVQVDRTQNAPDCVGTTVIADGTVVPNC
ncbi:hypothetical protein [Jannaschia aquimarina]|uniref:Uncharacterized protein n=1 Tax=Jannaschia aquimarina TaxID=935700 RepID=A0A0D1EG84_9RHOB|nr:hypothetical protein [Jannaschia aquimarina]KIT16674.1 hypothetical protein jaqu_14620 [Jannaschia aquimarina]SNS55492.1 hypothetical protein SAMN05421775_101416 [Jannaschia aquimarina]